MLCGKRFIHIVSHAGNTHLSPITDFSFLSSFLLFSSFLSSFLLSRIGLWSLWACGATNTEKLPKEGPIRYWSVCHRCGDRHVGAACSTARRAQTQIGIHIGHILDSFAIHHIFTLNGVICTSLSWCYSCMVVFHSLLNIDPHETL